jgi:hypothetical protein
MTRLEDLQPKAAVRGILPAQIVTVISTQWFGSDALELTYKGPSGRVANELLYRHDEQRLEVVEQGRPWSFDGDGHLFRLVSEAHRIRLRRQAAPKRAGNPPPCRCEESRSSTESAVSGLFDPVLAVHTSLVEPLPHQITAVYEAMLPRQPLRFLLADDPGSGKTIMAGLLIKDVSVTASTTAARSLGELKAEIATLGRLESLAVAVRRSGEDRKWRELASLLGEIFKPAALSNVSESSGTIRTIKPSPSQKLVVFTEHRDRLNYLEMRVATLLGRKEAMVVISTAAWAARSA